MLIEREGRFLVEGAMTMAQAARLQEAGDALCAGGDREIDLAQVSEVDSSALAVVLGWIRAAQAGKHRIVVHNPPQSFQSLAALYGADEVLAPYLDASGQ